MRNLIIGFLLVTLLGGAQTAQAGVKPGNAILSFGVGYATATNDVSGENIDGGSLFVSFESVGSTLWSVAFSIGYTKLNSTVQDATVTGATLDQSVGSWPFYLGVRKWLGHPTSRVQFNIGLGLGMYFSTLDVTRTTDDGSQEFSSVGTSGFGLGVPLGIALSVTETVIVQVNYVPNFVFDNDVIKNDVINTINLLLTFQIGQ